MDCEEKDALLIFLLIFCGIMLAIVVGFLIIFCRKKVSKKAMQSSQKVCITRKNPACIRNVYKTH